MTATSNNPMRYQYWSRNMTDIVPVALYGFRICGVGQSGYYAEMPTLPGQNGDWDFSEEAVAALEAERGKYEVYNTEHHHSEEWRPHIYTVPPPAEVIDDMRHCLAAHEREYGRSADHLNVAVDYADLVEWIAALEAAQESQEAPLMPVDEFIGATKFLAWLLDTRKAKIAVEKDGETITVGEDNAVAWFDLLCEYTEHEKTAHRRLADVAAEGGDGR